MIATVRKWAQFEVPTLSWPRFRKEKSEPAKEEKSSENLLESMEGFFAQYGYLMMLHNNR